MVVVVLAVAFSPSEGVPSTARSPPSPSAPCQLNGHGGGGFGCSLVALRQISSHCSFASLSFRAFSCSAFGACSSPAACTAWSSSRWRFLFERSPSSSLSLLFVSFGAALIAFATPPPPSPPPARRSSSSSSSKNDEGGPRRAAISPSVSLNLKKRKDNVEVASYLSRN